MKLYHVVAMARNRVIGRDNKLPWHFKSDLQNFKKLTLGQTVVMGRKTFESIGRPLPGRENFVLSRSRKEGAEGVRFFGSLDEALKAVRTEKCFIIGGAELYRQTLGRVDGIYLTRIEAAYEGDAFYPEIPPQYREVSTTRLQDDPPLDFVFLAMV